MTRANHMSDTQVALNLKMNLRMVWFAGMDIWDVYIYMFACVFGGLTFSCFMCLSSLSSLYVLLLWMRDWKGLESFLTATF